MKKTADNLPADPTRRADRRRISRKRKIVAAKTALGTQAPSAPSVASTPGSLSRPKHNPILAPESQNHWESQATFNPAAAYADGRVHIIYRAIGNDDVSVLGYASSEDGQTVSDRHLFPVFSARKNPSVDKSGPRADYGSGGGWSGGCEDPRLTFVDDSAYLLYTAFDGWGSIRVALTSMPLCDFLRGNWSWRAPVLISPAGEIHKNWVIFPEKIRGKFAVLHSISPEVRVDYFDTLDDFDGKEKVVRSKYEKAPRKKTWDSWVRGAGPPPIRTNYGWLQLYHAMDDQDPDRYKLGAMLLDLEDPTKVLFRSSAPILEPDECYENDGFKRGVVYSCGAVVMNENLFVYYGGADTVSCVAVAELEPFLQRLMSSKKAKLSPAKSLMKKPYGNRKAVGAKSNPSSGPVAPVGVRGLV